MNSICIESICYVLNSPFDFHFVADPKASADPKFMEAFGNNDFLIAVMIDIADAINVLYYLSPISWLRIGLFSS